MTEATKKTAEKPAITVRRGAIAASIWKRMAPSGFEYYDFSLSRSWKSKTSGKEGYSPNFFSGNESEIMEVVQEAASWIASKQVSVQAGLPAGKDEGFLG